jgi:hypothetical protein
MGRSFEQPSPEVCSVATLRPIAGTGNGTKVRLPWNELVGPAGIEPATLGLEIRCSIRLSYGPIMQAVAESDYRLTRVDMWPGMFG